MQPTDYLTRDQQSLDLELSGRMRDISVEITQYAAKDTLTEIEARNFEEITAEFDELEKRQEKLHREGRASYIGKAAANGAHAYRGDALDSDPFGEPDSIEERTFKNPWNLDEMRAYPFDAKGRQNELLARSLSAIEQMHGTTQARRQVMTDMIETNPKLAEVALVTSDPNYMAYWAGRMRFGQDYTPSPAEQKAVQRAMSLTDAEGGFLIPFQLDPSVIITADGSLNEIRKIARVVQATGDVWNGVSGTAVSFTWRAEAVEETDAAPTLAQPAIPIYKAGGFVPISIEALQDEPNVTSEVGRLLAFGKDVHDAAAFATGTGSAQPTGIVTALAGGASVVSSATTDVYAIADVYATQNGLPARYRPRASWLANNAIYNLTRQFDTGGGGGFWENLTSDRPALLMGKPAYEAENMDGVITALADNNSLIFGDFENYVIADRTGGMTVETIPHLFGGTANFPTGQRGFYAYYRVGADSVNDGGFSMLNIT